MQQPFYSLQKQNMNKKEYRRKNEEFLEEIRKEEGIHELPHGILYRITKSGEGTRDVGPRSIVTCYYRGSLISGKVFDDAWERGYPEAFRVSDLITGFQIALRAGRSTSPTPRLMARALQEIFLAAPRSSSIWNL